MPEVRHSSGRVHSRYRRTPADTAISAARSSSKRSGGAGRPRRPTWSPDSGSRAAARPCCGRCGRYRTGAYGEAVRVSVPDAVQVADRWHQWHNLVYAVKDTVVRHCADLRPPTESAGSGASTSGTEIDRSTGTANTEAMAERLMTRTRERHTAAQHLVSNLEGYLGNQQEAEPRPQDRSAPRPRP